jgi:hypothetical protein
VFALSIRLCKRRWGSPVDVPSPPRLRRRLRIHPGHAYAVLIVLASIAVATQV